VEEVSSLVRRDRFGMIRAMANGRLVRSLIAAALSVGFFQIVLPAQVPKSDDAHHWSYSGDHGPKHWAELDPQFAACKTGKYESPINIEQATISDLPALVFNYSGTPLDIVDNGHTVMVTYAPGSTLMVGDRKYELKQFHFHHPSEERIHGKQFDMVVHLVHQDLDGHLAVVAVLLTQGRENPLIAQLRGTVPAEKEHPVTLPELLINASDILPSHLGYYTFPGSLTTPPCTEGVAWYVLKTPVEISAEQLDWFVKLYPLDARPIQPLHGRTILETRD
jgi:carbonic anhydrase